MGVMLTFWNSSLSRKITTVIFFSNTVVLLIVFVFFVSESYFSYKKDLQWRMAEVAAQLAKATPLGVCANDNESVDAFLNGYGHEAAMVMATVLGPEVVSDDQRCDTPGAMVDRDQVDALGLKTIPAEVGPGRRPFALYLRQDVRERLGDTATYDIPAGASSDGVWSFLPPDLGHAVARGLAAVREEVAEGRRPAAWEGGYFLAVHPLEYQGRRIGHVAVVSDTGPFWTRLTARAPFLAGALVGIVVVALLLAYVFQRLVTGPIVELARTVRAITEALDSPDQQVDPFGQQIDGVRYSGELSVFVHDFNALLKKVGESEAQLREEKASLDRQVQERTAELRRRNRDLTEANEKAQAANIAKTQFVQVVTHELRTPLNAIKGYTDLLLEMFEDEPDDVDLEEVLHCLRQTRQAVYHNIDLVNQVLDFSSIETGKKTLQLCPYALRDILDDAKSSLFEYAKRNNNQVRLEIDATVGEIETDRTRLLQCLINVMGNACKFTENGVITLTVEAFDREAVPWVRFAVRDTGVGIPPEKLDSIFEPFSQADSSMSRKFAGTGLGLAVVKELVSRFGGRVWAESTLGEGSTFFIEVPQHPSTATRDASATEPGGPGAAAGVTATADDARRPMILLIDDDPAFHDRLRPILSGQGYRTRHAYSGEEGLALARQQAPLAILLDIIMPGKGGWQVLQEIKSDPDLSRIPVIVVTLAGDTDLAVTLGAADVFLKPVDTEVLTASLERWRLGGAPAQALIIDDDGFSRDLMRRSLEKHGWTVAEAADGEEGLAYLNSFTPSVILLDLMMPRMNGFQVVGRLRDRPDWALIPVIVISAKDLSDDERAFLQLNVRTVLEKGRFEARTLLGQIEALIGGESAAPSPPGATDRAPDDGEARDAPSA